MPQKKSIKDIANDVMALDREDVAEENEEAVKAALAERLAPDHPASALTKPVLIDGHDVTPGTIPRDPLKIKQRLYIQVGEMLHQLETGQGDDGPITVRERIAALTAIGRLQMVLLDKAKDDDENAGSSVRKYEGAFKNGAGRRKKAIRAASGDTEPDRFWSDDSSAED